MIRPSLWAAFGVALRVLLFLIPLVVLVAIPVSKGASFGAPDGPLILAFVDNIEFVIGVLIAFAPAVKIAFTRYTLDAEGIRVRSQVLQKQEQRVPWEKVTALRHRRSLLDRLVGLGRLDVVAYGERGTVLKLVGLRDDGALRDLVARRMRESASVEALFRGD